MFDKQRAILSNILISINNIEEFTQAFSNASEFNDNIALFDATIMNFIIIGEMTSKLGDDIKDKYTYIDWSKIIAFRNILAHNYFGIDEEEVWQIIKEDLPVLKNNVHLILNEI